MKKLILNGREIATRCLGTFEFNGVKLTQYIITMTPEDAREFLKQYGSITPRKINTQTVELYSSNMTSGKWDYCNGETIRIDENGKMIDFHHRLIAFSRTNEGPKEFLVLSNFSPKATQTIDQGLKRSPNNLAQFEGVNPPAGVMPIVNRKLNLDKGRLSGGQSSSNTKISPLDQKNEYFANKEFYDGVAKFSEFVKISTRGVVTRTEVGGIYAHLVLTLGWDEEYVKSFFTQYANHSPANQSIWTAFENNLKSTTKGRTEAWIVTFNAYVGNRKKYRQAYENGDWFVAPNKAKNMAL